MKANKFLTVTLPLFLWAAVIMILTSIPGDEMPEIPMWNWDKLAHGGVYLILAVLLFRYLFLVKSFTLHMAWVWGFIIGLLYAGIDELHQIPIPNRIGSWQDFVADALGVGAGIYASLRYFKQKMKQR